MAGIYVHIPFCKSRCIYCGFYSTTLGTDVMKAYVDGLCQEMEARKDFFHSKVQTIYLGGGTPSQLSPTLLSRLLLYIYKVYEVDSQAEVTIECNPDDITPEFAEAIAQLPTNRVSMGAQTFSDERLRWLHRRHTAQQVERAVSLLRQANITNISIDLMFGFPDESLADWQSDIHRTTDLKPEHISAYSLMVEEGTPLYKMMNSRNAAHSSEEDEEERSRQMYEMLIDELTAAGYEHYEISNFARLPQMSMRSFRSRHNSSYWNDTPYLGIGAAAHSYDGHRRWWNISDVKAYIERMRTGESAVEEQEMIDPITHYNDLITTALRTREGILLDTFRETFSADYYQYLMNNASPHIKRGTMTVDNGCLHLTRQGLFISDDIMSDLILLPSDTQEPSC